MTRRHFLPLLLVAFAATAAFATPVTPTQARATAMQFLESRNINASELQAVQTLSAARRARANNVAQPYYVFNTQAAQGYVIVAGDDLLPSVLGYSDSGSIDSENMPPAMEAMLDKYEQLIDMLAAGQVEATQHITNTPISPIMNAHWGQGEPYNQLLPTVAGSTAVVGCVGTAMAQVMYHHKWPAQPTKTIPEYTSSTYNTFRPALEPTTFQWNLMKPFHLKGGDADANNAVATLSVYVDQALQMKFGNGSSSASTSSIAEVLPKYFAYNNRTIRYVQRKNYTTIGWESMIYNELKANRPVIYRGDKNPGGHAFVCDGYDGNGLFHINWGWHTNSDGFFLLAGLDPKSQGTGSSDQSWGYIFDEACVIGIQPGTGDESPSFMITASNVSINNTFTLTRSSSSYDFSANIGARFYNRTNATLVPDVGWGLYQNGNLLSLIRTTWYSELKPNYYGNLQWNVSFGKDLPNGTYYLYPVCRPHNQGDWMLCEGAEANHIIANISGNTCTLTGIGSAGETNYTLKNAVFSGTMNHGKRVDLDIELTNNGTTEYDFIYLFVDGVKSAVGISDIQRGETGNVHFNFTPTTAGTKNIALSFDENCINTFYSTTINIASMPEYAVGTTVTVLNRSGLEINGNTFSADVKVRNTGSRAYKEDIVAKLYRITAEGGTTGTLVQTKTQNLNLALNKTTTIRFDMDNVYDGQRYFMIVYYYSEGEQVRGGSSSTFTVILPPAYETGDINGDSKIDISDLNTLINIILGNEDPGKYSGRDNVDGQGGVDINDINMLINLILSN